MKKNKTKSTTNKSVKDFYSFKNYKPNKNAVPVNYKGTEYLSKAQCMALEGITRKELDAYLNGQEEGVTRKELDAYLKEEEQAIVDTFVEVVNNVTVDNEQSIEDLLNND